MNFDEALRFGLNESAQAILTARASHADTGTTLDATVLEAYGFSKRDELLASLLDIDHDIAGREKSGTPVTAPG